MPTNCLLDWGWLWSMMGIPMNQPVTQYTGYINTTNTASWVHRCPILLQSAMTAMTEMSSARRKVRKRPRNFWIAVENRTSERFGQDFQAFRNFPPKFARCFSLSRFLDSNSPIFPIQFVMIHFFDIVRLSPLPGRRWTRQALFAWLPCALVQPWDMNHGLGL